MRRYESTCWPLSLLSEFFHAPRDLFNLIISLDPCDTGFPAHVTKKVHYSQPFCDQRISQWYQTGHCWFGTPLRSQFCTRHQQPWVIELCRYWSLGPCWEEGQWSNEASPSSTSSRKCTHRCFCGVEWHWNHQRFFWIRPPSKQDPLIFLLTRL